MPGPALTRRKASSGHSSSRAEPVYYSGEPQIFMGHPQHRSRSASPALEAGQAILDQSSDSEEDTVTKPMSQPARPADSDLHRPASADNGSERRFRQTQALSEQSDGLVGGAGSQYDRRRRQSCDSGDTSKPPSPALDAGRALL
eukprot:scaffold651332_cov46-Prasinocladus_malaysianus.AAC.1